MADSLERQLAELEVLEAIYPDELTMEGTSIQCVRQFVANPGDVDQAHLPLLSCTIALSQLASLKCGDLDWCQPSMTLEFPAQYPESTPPLLSVYNLDIEHASAIASCIQDHEGQECTMQLVQALNDCIELHNAQVMEAHKVEVTKQEEADHSKSIREAARQDAAKAAEALAVPILGRRVINSPYIVKPAKIKDIKRCADELKLGGYAKVGKPGIIVIEGSEACCQRYVPMLKDLGWEYQTVQGEQQQEGTAGQSIESMRAFPTGFKVLGEDTMSELSQLCRDAGLADLFFSSLRIHNSAG